MPGERIADLLSKPPKKTVQSCLAQGGWTGIAEMVDMVAFQENVVVSLLYKVNDWITK